MVVHWVRLDRQGDHWVNMRSGKFTLGHSVIQEHGSLQADWACDKVRALVMDAWCLNMVYTPKGSGRGSS